MSIKYDFENNTIGLSVKDLVYQDYSSFSNINIPIKSRGKLGRDIHRSYFRGKKGVQKEVFVKKENNLEEVSITIQGRIDGVTKLEDRIIVEEVKSVLIPDEKFSNLNIPDVKHFSGQLMVYSMILAELEDLPIIPRLILFNLLTGEIRELEPEFDLAEVKKYYSGRLKEIVDNFLFLKVQNHERTIAGKLLKFPFPKKRETQEIMNEKIEGVLDGKDNLIMAAPAGCGKTAGTLYPVIKYALKNNKRVFYVTSKNTQQQLVRETVAKFKGVKTLFLRTSDEMCLNNIKFCSTTFCPYLENYITSGAMILPKILEADLILPDSIYQLSKQLAICPFEVSLAVSEVADLIVGDYNYVFDPRACLKRLFMSGDYSNFILIVDEIHNLVARSRDYYSVRLTHDQVKSAKKFSKLKTFSAQGEMRRVLNGISRLFKEYYERGKQEFPEFQKYSCVFDEERMQGLFADYERAYIKYLLEEGEVSLEEALTPLFEFYYDFQNFLSVLGQVGGGFSTMFSAEHSGVFEIFCLDARVQLAEKINGFHSVIGMSATLNPLEYYMEVLGFSANNTKKLTIPSPFPRENRAIMVVPSISTTYNSRMQDYMKIGELIRKVVSVKEGNYLVFFPSFEYLEHVSFFIREQNFRILKQRRRMNNEERGSFLEHLHTSEEPILLMGVQGGVFAEGVDYIGDTAIGVIVVGPQIAPPTFEQENLCNYYQESNGHGFEYAYLYPGMNITIQAAGRVIRSRSDKGIIILLGKRFTYEQYYSLFPKDWDNISVIETGSIEEELIKFWGG